MARILSDRGGGATSKRAPLTGGQLKKNIPRRILRGQAWRGSQARSGKPRTWLDPSSQRPDLGFSSDLKWAFSDMVQTRACVNWSPKNLDLRKCPSPIRTSVGQAIFSRIIFGQAITYTNIRAFLNFIQVYKAQFSERYCNVCFSLCISDREYLTCRDQFVNISNEK